MTYTNGKEVFVWDVVQDNKLGRAVEFYVLITADKAERVILFRASLPVDTNSNSSYFKRRFDDGTRRLIQSLV